MAIVMYAPNDKDKPILDEINTKIMQSLDEWYGGGAHFDASHPDVRSYRNSFILRYPIRDAAGRSTAILVKIRRKPKMDALWQAVDADIHANIPSEYDSLKFVYSHLAGVQDAFSAIRPLAYLENHHAIVMEEFPSRTLRQVLIEHRSSPNGTGMSELLDVAVKTGKWLHHFHHTIHTPVVREYSPKDIVDLVSDYATRLEANSRGRIDARSIVQSFLRKLENIQIHAMTFSQSHADMTCDNVLYSDDRKVCVIDIKTHPAPIYSDLGLIQIHPETIKPQIFRAGTYLPESILKEYRAAILRGYFGSEEYDASFVRIFNAIKILDKWLMYEELMCNYKGIKHLLSLPAGPYVSAYFHNRLKKHLDFIDIQAGNTV